MSLHNWQFRLAWSSSSRRTCDLIGRPAPGHGDRRPRVWAIKTSVIILTRARSACHLCTLSWDPDASGRTVALNVIRIGYASCAVSPVGYVESQGTLWIVVAIVLYRLAFLVLDCLRRRSVSHLVVCRVVDGWRDVERAVVPLVEVVLFGFFHHGWSRSRSHMRQRILSSLSTWLLAEIQASRGLVDIGVCSCVVCRVLLLLFSLVAGAAADSQWSVGWLQERGVGLGGIVSISSRPTFPQQSTKLGAEV